MAVDPKLQVQPPPAGSAGPGVAVDLPPPVDGAGVRQSVPTQTGGYPATPQQPTPAPVLSDSAVAPQVEPDAPQPQAVAGPPTGRNDELMTGGKRTVYEFTGDAAVNERQRANTFIGGAAMDLAPVEARQDSNLSGGGGKKVLVGIGLAVVIGGIAAGLAMGSGKAEATDGRPDEVTVAADQAVDAPTGAAAAVAATGASGATGATGATAASGATGATGATGAAAPTGKSEAEAKAPAPAEEAKAPKPAPAPEKKPAATKKKKKKPAPTPAPPTKKKKKATPIKPKKPSKPKPPGLGDLPSPD